MSTRLADSLAAELRNTETMARSTIKRNIPSSLVNRVKRDPLPDQIANELRHLIRTGELPGGTRLIETELASTFGVSRGPVRDALKLLANEHLLTMSAGRSSVVAEWNAKKIRDLYEVRTLLEPQAVQRALTANREACVSALRQVMSDWNDAVDREDRPTCEGMDFIFHQTIWKQCENDWLDLVLEQLVAPCQIIFYHLTAEGRDLRRNRNIHDQLITLFERQSSDVAVQAMRNHLDNSLTQALENL